VVSENNSDDNDEENHNFPYKLYKTQKCSMLKEKDTITDHNGYRLYSDFLDRAFRVKKN
jgi:hypothetical protein